MKKKNHVLSFILIVFTAIVGFTCKQHVGLGGQIDILPPKGEITYPDAGETPIRGSFVLKGSASDDDGIQSISVVFENIETKEKSQTYQAEGFSKGSVSASWTVDITNEATGTVPGHELVKVYPIPDGEYTAILSVTDKGGKTSTFTKNYKIDNTPPVFIVSRPSTVVENNGSGVQADPYGAIFTVVGQAEDKNKIEELTLKVKDSDISISKQFVGKNINEEIATASADSVGNYTDPLYRYNAEHKNPKIKAHISLMDNARFFKGSGGQGRGNISEWYYLRDKKIRSVLEKGYTADIINDYFAGKKGSAGSANKTDKLLAALYDENNPEGQAVKQILKDARIMTETEGGVKYSIFTLDPNKSPGFKVINAESLPSVLPGSTPDAALPHPSVQFFGTNNPPTVFIDLLANKTNEPLVESYNYTAYRESGIVVNLYKCNEVAYITSGSNKILNVETSITPAHSLKFEDLTPQDELDRVVELTGDNKLTIKWKLPKTFAEGNYVLRVEGKDTHDNEFVAYDKNNAAGGMYVIKFQTAGNTPVIVPRSPSGYIKEGFHVIANVSSLGAGAVVRYKLDGEAGEHDTALINTPDTTEWKTATAIPLTSIANGMHSIHFWAKDTVKKAVKGKIEFIVDTKAPDAALTYPPATAAQAGMVTIMGSVSDEYAGVRAEGTKYIIGKKSPIPTVDSHDWQSMGKSSPVSWQFMYNLDDFSSTIATDGNPVAGQPGIYDIPVYILTEDKIGNKKVTEKSVRFDSDGDKPVITILSPQQNQTLGGIIQIFGTATTRANGPSVVGEVYIQFSKNGNFEDTTHDNMTFGSSEADYDADWYKSGKGQPIAGTASGGANWQLSINGNGAFNNPNGENWEVYFRIRAKNKVNHKYGPWSGTVKISIDKAYPTIGSPVPLKLVNANGSAGEENYISDMWIPDGKKLTGSLYDDSGIKAVTISSPELLGNQTYYLSDALSHGWIAEDSAHAPNPATGAKNYKLQIPLTLSTLSDAVKRKGELSIKIKIVENTPKELSFENTVKFHFDIIPPSGALGDFIYRYGGEVKIASITDNTLAQKVTTAASTAPTDYSKLRLLIGGKIVKITGVTGTTVHFEPALERSGTYNCLLYKEPFVISNESGKWIVRGVANDDGSGVKKIEAKVTVNEQSTASPIIEGTKITKYLGGQVSWVGEIDLSTLPDGKGQLTCKIYDERGIMYEVPPVNVVVKNKPLTVQGITLVTDIGGSSVLFENTAANKALKNVKVDTNLDFTADFTSSEFAFKNKDNSKIKVNFTGGYGTVKYQLKKEDGTKLGGLTAITSGGEIDLKDHLNAIGNSNGTPTKITLELWGQAHGFTQGVDSTFAKITITTLFDALDGKAPTVVILPFHWNGEGDNSLYQNSRANGHVEIAGINSLGNNHASVSGKVTLHGFAYDNIKIDSIKAELPFNPPLTVTAMRSGTAFNSSQTMAANGAELKVIRLGADYLGYYVQWELSFDSSKIMIGSPKDIKVTANDGGRNSAETTGTDLPAVFQTVNRGGDNSASHSSFASAKAGQFVVFRTGDKQYVTRIIKKDSATEVTFANPVPTEMKQAAVYDYPANKTKVTVNSVPYITEIETKNRIKSGLSKNTIRASNGKYSIMKGSETDFIAVKGFNLSGTPLVVRLVKENDRANAGISTGIDLTAHNVSATGFDLSNDLSSSGYLEVFVNTIRAANNINDNAKPYNKEEDLYVLKNKHLNDDRYLRVFDMKKTTQPNGYYPEMIMDGDDPVFGYIDLSGKRKSETAIKSTFDPPYPTVSNYQPKRAKFKADGSQESVEYLVGGMQWEQMAMARDESGRYHHLSIIPAKSSGMCYIYDRYAELHTWNAKDWNKGVPKTVNDGWGIGAIYNGYEGALAVDANNNAIGLDSVVYQGLMIDRYKYPKLIVKGNSKTTAYVYLAYFDAGYKDILFRNFQLGTSVAGTSYNLATSGTSSTGETYQQKVNFKENPGKTGDDEGQADPTYNIGRLFGTKEHEARKQSSDPGSEYFDIGVTADNHVVLLYFNDTEGRLRLRYSRDTVDGRDPTQQIDWIDSPVGFPSYVGTYVSMDIDTYGGLHIAAFDSVESDLKYFYLPSYNSTNVTALTVDAAFSVGQWTQIKVHNDKPYIAYYNVSEAGQRSAVKLAVANGTVTNGSIGTVKEGVDAQGFVTGAWDCMTVPTISPAQGNTVKFKKVNLGFDTAGRPVLGYLGSYIEFGKWLDE